MPGVKRQYEGWKSRVPEAEVAALALRYQDGMQALQALEGRLAPVVESVLEPYEADEFRPWLARRALHQKSRAVLADLALAWRPQRRFLGYFFTRFPSAMARYVLSCVSRSRGPPRPNPPPHPPSRVAGGGRERRVTAPAAPYPPEGPDWLNALHERLRAVPDLERRVFVELTLENQRRIDVARRLGTTPSTVHRVYLRALARLGDGWQPRFAVRPELLRLLRTLHAAAGRYRSVPGTRFTRSATGLTPRELRELMAELVAAGAIVGRQEGVAGRLVEPSWRATLARVEAARQALKD